MARLPFSVDAVMREPFFIPETMRVDVLMKALQERNAHMAIVVDEYGGTLGIVTLEDLIEEIVGEIFDEFDQNQMAELVQATAEGHLSVPGDMPIAELNERYHLTFLKTIMLRLQDCLSSAGTRSDCRRACPGAGRDVSRHSDGPPAHRATEIDAAAGAGGPMLIGSGSDIGL